MNKELFEALDILEKEKGISKAYMIERIEAALLSAFRKENGGYENARVKLDPVKQDVKLYKQLTVVEEVTDSNTEISLEDARMKSKRYKVGDIYEIEQKTKTFGRIAAQKLISEDFKVTRQHGEFIQKGNILFMGTFHPAALLRNPNNKPDALSDFQNLRNKINELKIEI